MSTVAGSDGPPITVLMSVYNGERWLDEAILSVLNQTFADFEFIIVNDGSTDGSLGIANTFAAKDSRIKVIDKPHSGLSDSLNVGIKQARGAWIARLDADDLCEPQRLEKQYELARSEPSLVLIGTGLRQIDEQGRPGKVFRYPRGHARLVANLTTARRFFAHSSAFYRTDAVRTIGSYRKRCRRAEDWDLWLRLSEYGQMACIDRPLVRVRQHDHQISHDEGGQRQLVDAYVAMISYWLRRYGYPDFSHDRGHDFKTFHTWVEESLRARRVVEYRGHILNMKTNIEKESALSSKFWVVFFSLVCKPMPSCRYLRNRLFGEILPRELAMEWIVRNPMIP